MALNLVGTVSKIKVEVAERKDGTKYNKYKVTVATKNNDGSTHFQDVPVVLTKNVDMSLINEPVEVQSGWLSTDGEKLTIVINKVVKPEHKADVPL
jgi:hypothetical protein